MTATLPYSAPNIHLVALPMDRVFPSPINPRKVFDEATLQELAESIRQHGILQPIVVRRMPVERQMELLGDMSDGPVYEIVAGERRFRASALCEQETIPGRVLEDITDEQHLRLALIENLQRQDLDPIEEAEGYRALNKVVGLRQAEIAAAVNRSQPAVANAMRLLELPADVQERIRRRELSVSHGIALAKYKDFPKVLAALAKDAVERGLTSKRLEGTELLGEHQYKWHQQGIVRAFDYNTKFDKAGCQECPFNAYRALSYGSALCLKPEHFDQLEQEHEEQRRRDLEAKIAAAAAAGAPMVRLADLKHGEYEQFYSSSPAGCSSDCPCRQVALGYSDQPVEICTDPKRYRSLKVADTKAAKKDKRAEMKRHISRLEAHVEALGEPGVRELALLAAAAIAGNSRPTSGQAAAEHLGVAEPLRELKFARYELQATGLETLAQLPADVLIKLAVEAVIRDDLAGVFDGYDSNRKRFEWYLGAEQPAERAEPDADAGEAAWAEYRAWKQASEFGPELEAES